MTSASAMASLFRPVVPEQSGSSLVFSASKAKPPNNGLKKRRVFQAGDSIEYMTDSSLDSLPFIDDEEYEDTRRGSLGFEAAEVVMYRTFLF